MMKYFECLDQLSNIRSLILEDLSEIGIIVQHVKSIKNKKHKAKEDLLSIPTNLVFGIPLALVPCALIQNYGKIPIFLVNAFAILEKHLTTEGLFRKPGSLTRIKSLKQRIDVGEILVEDDDMQPADLACLVKLYLRDLPDPLLTHELYDVFVSAAFSDDPPQRDAILLHLCLLLPLDNIAVLRYLIDFTHKIIEQSPTNRMDATNLALCLAPNLLYRSNMTSCTENSPSRILEAETTVVKVLIESGDTVGNVSEGLYQRAQLLSSMQHDINESRTSNNQIPKSCLKKKKRSGSLQGLVTSLGSSFSRWRQKSGQNDNSNLTDRSTVSYTSFDSSCMKNGNKKVNIDAERIDAGKVSVTPVLIKKRKMDDDPPAFTASKRKAVLQSLPHRSHIPHINLLKNQSNDLVFTPDVRPICNFSHNSNVIFSATPKYKTTSKLLSSAKISRRMSSGKSGCFSPKSQKYKVRSSFRGFLRRLSGNKEPQLNKSNEQNSSSFQSNLKKFSLFSKSAKGLNVLLSQPKYIDGDNAFSLISNVNDPVRTQLLSKYDTIEDLQQSSFANLGHKSLIEDLQPKNLPPRPSQRLRTRSVDRSVKPHVLRRGRPNTLRTGLKSTFRHRSVEVRSNYARRSTIKSDRHILDDRVGIGAMETSPIGIPASHIVNSDDEEVQKHCNSYQDTTSSDIDSSFVSADSNDLDTAFTENDLDETNAVSNQMKKTCSSDSGNQVSNKEISIFNEFTSIPINIDQNIISNDSSTLTANLCEETNLKEKSNLNLTISDSVSSCNNLILNVNNDGMNKKDLIQLDLDADKKILNTKSNYISNFKTSLKKPLLPVVCTFQPTKLITMVPGDVSDTSIEIKELKKKCYKSGSHKYDLHFSSNQLIKDTDNSHTLENEINNSNGVKLLLNNPVVTTTVCKHIVENVDSKVTSVSNLSKNEILKFAKIPPNEMATRAMKAALHSRLNDRMIPQIEVDGNRVNVFETPTNNNKFANRINKENKNIEKVSEEKTDSVASCLSKTPKILPPLVTSSMSKKYAIRNLSTTPNMRLPPSRRSPLRSGKEPVAGSPRTPLPIDHLTLRLVCKEDCIAKNLTDM